MGMSRWKGNDTTWFNAIATGFHSHGCFQYTARHGMYALPGHRSCGLYGSFIDFFNHDNEDVSILHTSNVLCEARTFECKCEVPDPSGPHDILEYPHPVLRTVTEPQTAIQDVLPS